MGIITWKKNFQIEIGFLGNFRKLENEVRFIISPFGHNFAKISKKLPYSRNYSEYSIKNKEFNFIDNAFQKYFEFWPRGSRPFCRHKQKNL